MFLHYIIIKLSNKDVFSHPDLSINTRLGEQNLSRNGIVVLIFCFELQFS